VHKLKASYDEALARLGVSEAEAESLRAKCDEVRAKLYISRTVEERCRTVPVVPLFLLY